jgi:hypothetical protein
MDTLVERQSPWFDVSVKEMYLILTIIVPMRHDQKGTLRDYWLTQEQCYMARYGYIVKCDRFFHIPRFLHYSENRKGPDKTVDNYD